MKSESGRSLIEIVGVLAITAVMTASAIAIYNSIRRNQSNTIASAQLREVVKNTKLLMEMRDDYTGVSVEYLVKAGALANDKPPIGTSWSIDVGTEKNTFVINLMGLTSGECEFFANAVPNWATEMFVNKYRFNGYSDCFSTGNNEISFVIE